MARRRNRPQRDTTDIANLDELLGPSFSPDPTPLLEPQYDPLTLLEDRRLFHPEPDLTRPALSFDGRHQRLEVPREVRELSNRVGPIHQVGFAGARRVAVCVRRQRRREVLHALKKMGRGGGRRRRNQWSDIKC